MRNEMSIQKHLIRSLLKETQWSLDLRILLEDYRTDKIIQMVNKRLPEQDRLEQEELEQMIEADPTAKNGAGKYSEWIVKQYINSDEGYRSRFFEDLYKYTNALKKFHELKTRNKIDIKDINQVKDLWELQELIKGDEQESILEGFPDTRKLEAKGEAEVLLRDPEFHLYWTKTHNANTILGSNTQWCTVPKGSSHFDSYNKQGPLFILYAKEGKEIERYQYHFESEQFMDEDNQKDDHLLKNNLVENAFLKFAKEYKSGSIAVYYKDKSLLQDEEIQLNAVKQNGLAIRFIENPSEQVQLEAVSENGWVIRFIENPSEQVQFEAVRQSGLAIKFIKNPSEQMKLEAVRQSGLAIQFIENPSEQMKLEAVRQSGLAIKFIENPSEQVQLEAVRQSGWAIQFIKNPSERVQFEAEKSKENEKKNSTSFI